jgi:hypothetical protein
VSDREEDDRAHALALELYALDRPFELVLQPITLLHLVGLLQLALRHPNIDPASSDAESPTHAQLAGNVITAARAYFAECPITLELIRQGADPAFDVPSRRGPHG